MAHYAIGDIQGCYQSLRKLLDKIKFDPLYDQLFLAGDMINRGNGSLAVMDFILTYQDNVQCVLGNHDLHFLAVANLCQPISQKDTFDDILNSNLKDSIVYWLSKQPLAFHIKEYSTLMVHAGLPASWSLSDTLKYSTEVSQTLQSSAAFQFYVSMYGNQPSLWSKQLAGVDRLRFITNALTRMRYCFPNGQLELEDKSPPGNQENILQPWFKLKNRRYTESIVFGHWASLNGKCPVQNIHALDTGCVWGGKLTAIRLQDNRRFSVKAS